MTTDASPPGSAPAAAGNSTTAQTAPASRDGTSAPKPGEASPTPLPQKYKFDFEGSEREYDLNELKANYLKGKNSAQMMSKADQRLREASEKEKKYSSLPERLRKEGAKVLQELGLNEVELEQFAEGLLLPKIQQQMLTEEQRQVLDARNRAESAERRIKEIEERAQQAEQDRLTSEHQQRIGSQFVQALEKTGLPQSSAPWAVRRMAALAEKADELELDFSPDDLATIVRDDFMQEHRALASGMSPEQIIAWLGDDVVKKIRQHDIARLKQRLPGGMTQPPAQGITNSTAPKTNGTRKYMSETEWLEEEQRRIREG